LEAQGTGGIGSFGSVGPASLPPMVASAVKWWLCSLVFTHAALWVMHNYDGRLHVQDNALNLFAKFTRTFSGRLPREDDSESIASMFTFQHAIQTWTWSAALRSHNFLSEKISIPSEDLPSIEVYLHRRRDRKRWRRGKRDRRSTSESDREDGGEKGPSENKKKLPVLVWFHGGGFVSGDARDTHLIRILKHFKQDVLVASVQYRLAPQAPFPAPVEDATHASVWLYHNVHIFGGDPDRFCVGGVDAGGTLAAVVHQEASKLGIKVKATIVFAPYLRFGATTRSYMEYSRIGTLPYDLAVWNWRCYCSTSDAGDPRCCPIEVRGKMDPREISPIFIVTNRYDPLRDEGREYAQRLSAEGIEVTHTELFGTHHHALICDLPGVRRIVRQFEERMFANDSDASQQDVQRTKKGGKVNRCSPSTEPQQVEVIGTEKETTSPTAK